MSELPSASRILSRIGRTADSEIIAESCCPFLATHKSICFKKSDPRKGSKPHPLIVVQPVSFSTCSLLTASTHINTLRISSSVRFAARVDSMHPKSSSSQSSREDRITAPTSGGVATANRAADGFGRYDATSANMLSGRSAKFMPFDGDEAVLRRLALSPPASAIIQLLCASTSGNGAGARGGGAGGCFWAAPFASAARGDERAGDRRGERREEDGGRSRLQKCRIAQNQAHVRFGCNSWEECQDNTSNLRITLQFFRKNCTSHL